MERYSSRKMDELGRVVLHGELRKKLGLEKGSKISLTVIDSIVVIQQKDFGDCEICDLGIISIPREIRQKFEWIAGSEVAVYHTDSLLLLKTA